jgi:3-hydroxyisobutyrate dehydrogenase
VTVARSPRVAFLGLGAMGYPMAGRIAARFGTLVWNRTEAVACRHAEEFGTRPAGLADLADVDVVVSCLASAPVVAAVADAARPSLRPGSVWVDCTSGEP